jgi:hypothetical protein
MCKLNAVVALQPRSTLFTKVAGGLDELEARMKADHYNTAADCYGFNAQKQAQLDESFRLGATAWTIKDPGVRPAPTGQWGGTARKPVGWRIES